MKPTDSAGSKGCSRVDSENELQKALDYAMEHSIGKHIIVEEFIEKVFDVFSLCGYGTECVWLWLQLQNRKYTGQGQQ